MTHRYKEVHKNSWGSRLVGSIKGVFVGIFMFFISFGVLYWNEGRVDVSNIAKTAIEIEATSKASQEADQQLVSTTGQLKSEENLGDTYLKEGDYIAISRKAEIFVWSETTSTETKKNYGGSETVETTYTYEKKWTSNPSDSSSFKQPDGHSNPNLPIDQFSATVSKAKLGIYDIDMSQVSIPAGSSLPLTQENTIVKDEFEVIGTQYLYKGLGSLASPEPGDIRISYSAVTNPIQTATVFGKLNLTSSKISPFFGKKDTKLYSLSEGTREGAISAMELKHTATMWTFRIVGFLLMWFGLSALFGPISVILDVVPLLGTLSKGAVGLITFIVSLALSAITILVSMILHSFIALIIIVAGLSIIGVIYLKKRDKEVKKS